MNVKIIRVWYSSASGYVLIFVGGSVEGYFDQILTLQKFHDETTVRKAEPDSQKQQYTILECVTSGYSYVAYLAPSLYRSRLHVSKKEKKEKKHSPLHRHRRINSPLKECGGKVSRIYRAVPENSEVHEKKKGPKKSP